MVYVIDSLFVFIEIKIGSYYLYFYKVDMNIILFYGEIGDCIYEIKCYFF